MEAHEGDRVVIDAKKVGQSRRRGEIIRIEGHPERPRMWVRWDDGHESLLVSGPGLTIEPKR